MGGLRAAAAASGLAFVFLAGWPANVAAVAVVAISQAIPAVAFSHNVVWPWMAQLFMSIGGGIGCAQSKFSCSPSL